MSKCDVCDQERGVSGGAPDPCLGYLPGVAHACCGHGVVGDAYCVGWPGCHPNESCSVGRKHPEYWGYHGKPAVECLQRLVESA